MLKLNSDKALKDLNWRCILNANQTISLLVNWYRVYYEKKNNSSMYEYSINQIRYYEKLINKNLYNKRAYRNKKLF